MVVRGGRRREREGETLGFTRVVGMQTGREERERERERERVRGREGEEGDGGTESKRTNRRYTHHLKKVNIDNKKESTHIITGSCIRQACTHTV